MTSKTRKSISFIIFYYYFLIKIPTAEKNAKKEKKNVF